MSSTGRKRIAVIGATGQQGGAVMHALQARGQFTVRALTDDRIALANKVAGGQPTSFAVWARERTSRLLNRRPSDLVSTLAPTTVRGMTAQKAAVDEYVSARLGLT
jgi:nucleoside-diphosphate-sugar epimerase